MGQYYIRAKQRGEEKSRRENMGVVIIIIIILNNILKYIQNSEGILSLI